MRIKKVISCGLSLLIAVISICTGISSNCVSVYAGVVNYDELFEWQYDEGNSVYKITGFKNNLEELLGEDGRVEMPEKHTGDQGELGVTYASNIFRTTPAACIKELKLTKNDKTATAKTYVKMPALKKVEFPYEGADFTISGSTPLFYDVSSNPNPAVEEIYIYASSLKTTNAEAFQGLKDGLKIYVMNDDVKNTLVSVTASSSRPIKESEILKITTGKKTSRLKIQCSDIYFGDEKGLQPSVVSGETEGDGEISYELYNDAACHERASYKIDGYIPIGVYYLLGRMAPSDTYDGCVSESVRVEVKAHEPLNKEKLQAAIQQAEEFQKTHDEVNFDHEKWLAVSDALRKAKQIDSAEEGVYSQEQADTITQQLTDALAALQDAKADNTAQWDALQEVVKQANAIVEKVDKEEILYTEETYTALQRYISMAAGLQKDTASVEEIEGVTRWLQDAIDKLEVKNPNELEAGEPFVLVQKGGKEAVILNTTANAALAGAKMIKVTFKCADDVSFNEYSDIDVTAVVGGVKTYQKFAGNNYDVGAENAVTLKLEQAVKEGDIVQLAADTYSWNNASSYVYGITKVEFLTEEGVLLYTFIDKTIAQEKLSQAVEKAESMDLSGYTQESVDKLKKAIEDAKALKEDATAEEINKAVDAIDEAVKGLTKKAEEPSPGPGDGNGSGQGSGNVGQTPGVTEEVLGIGKGKVFEAGNLRFKVTTAATIAGEKKTTGKVTVVGLTKAGKKKTSVTVKNTVSASGASYTVTALGSKAFKKAAKLKKVNLGTNIKSLPTSAFDGCKKLSTVSAKGVTKIGKSAFKGCKVLKKVTLKKKLTSVKKGAFKGCKKSIKISGGSKKVNKANVKKLKKSGYKKFK